MAARAKGCKGSSGRTRSKRRTKGKNLFKKGTPLIWIAIVLIASLILTVLDYFGHNPIDWIHEQIFGSQTTADDSLEIHFIDVGQGDCIYITCGGTNMLIDGGEAGEAANVADYLNAHNVSRLDYVVGTHPHSDHMGCMSSIIERFDIGQVIIPHLADKDVPTTRYFEKFLDACDKKGLRIHEAVLGETLSIGESSAEIIAPCSKSYSGLNNYSIGIMLTHGRNRFLLTGDAEASAEREMVQSGKLKRVRVYKAGHHGSDTSSSDEFLEIIQPEYAVISCGKDNKYGHPHNSTIKKLQKYTKEIYRTDECGDIVFESDGISLSVRTERVKK